MEEGLFSGEITLKTARMYLTPLRRKKIEALILGCTHYPFLKPVIQKVMGKKVKLIDTAEEVARELKETLLETNLIREEKTEENSKDFSKDMFFASDVSETFIEVAERLLNRKVNFEEIDIERY